MMKKLTGNNTTWEVYNTDVRGNNNTVYGSRNRVAGENNRIFGNSNTIFGNNCKAEGDDNSFFGTNNVARGVGNTASGFNNRMKHNTNKAPGPSNTKTNVQNLADVLNHRELLLVLAESELQQKLKHAKVKVSETEGKTQSYPPPQLPQEDLWRVRPPPQLPQEELWHVPSVLPVQVPLQVPVQVQMQVSVEPVLVPSDKKIYVPTISLPKMTIDEPEAAPNEDKICALCLFRKANCAIVDCGHSCFCVRCSHLHCKSPRQNPTCPLCREKITKIIQVF